jgi:hypothetical protein
MAKDYDARSITQTMQNMPFFVPVHVLYSEAKGSATKCEACL